MWVADAVIRFLFAPGGKIFLAVLVFISWTYYQRADATSNCNRRQFELQLQEANQRLAEADRIAQTARARADRTEAEIQKLEAELDGIISTLPTEGPSCRIPPDLAERLQRIQ